MWVNKQLFDMIVADNKAQQLDLHKLNAECAVSASRVQGLREQKSKDDITIDWMRHRINALEKTNAVLLQKAAGVFVPVPEIVPTRPGTITEPADFSHMPSFADVGDEEAKRLGVAVDDLGFIKE